MCGIYGVMDFSRRERTGPLLARMGELIEHRGPDDQGHYESAGVARRTRKKGPHLSYTLGY